VGFTLFFLVLAAFFFFVYGRLKVSSGAQVENVEAARST
jgi:hypothetical protein